jgi:hypothetical protein
MILVLLICMAIPANVLDAARRYDAAMKADAACATAGGEASAPVFRGANLDIQFYRGREWVLSGPRETGKTWAAVWLLDTLMRETPNAHGVLARKIQTTLWGTVIVTYKRIQELRRSLGNQPAEPYGGEKPEWYTYENDARLWVGGLDNPNKMLSGERDFIYINQAEELKVEDWETLISSCTGRGAVTKTPMVFGDCNPSSEDHWILKRPSLKLFHSRHVDNPSLYDDAGGLTEQGERSITQLQTLTGVRRSRLYEGKWVGAEGQFFEEFDDDLHTREPFSVPADWPIWGAFDYGFAHPTAFGLFTQDNDGIIYLLGEHVQHKWLPPAHCKAIRRLAQRLGIQWHRVKQIVAGHDVFQQRGDKDAKTIAQQYAEARDPETNDPIGLTFEKATLDRITGAQELLTRLGNLKADIKPTLKLSTDCTRTIACMKRMVTDPRDPEDVLKVDADANGDGGDDEYDMLRYGVMVKRAKKSHKPAVGGARTAVSNFRRGVIA